MAKTVRVRIELVVEMDEDRLKDIFEEQDIKFTKKKALEVAEDFENSFDASEVEELVENYFVDFLTENYGE
jgi:hypothetical protein